MVQDILSSLDYDDVSSINDTDEAQQVATVIENSFEYIVDQYKLKNENALFELSGTVTDNVRCQLPSNVSRLDVLRYDKKESLTDPVKYGIIDYVDPKEFLRRSAMRDSTDSTIDTVSHDGGSLFIRNDVHPTYYTSFDNQEIIFDAYNSTMDASGITLAKTQCYGEVRPSFTKTDSFTFPDLSDHLISLMFTEAKSMAWQELKQTTTQATERRRRKQEVRVQKVHDRINNRPNHYGRGRS